MHSYKSESCIYSISWFIIIFLEFACEKPKAKETVMDVIRKFQNMKQEKEEEEKKS